MEQSVTFFNGQKMPQVGLGTWLATDPEALERALDEALKAGYRHIDTAYVYQNEHIIGNVLQRWMDEGIIKRDELFITTKLPPIGMTPAKVEYFMRKSLSKLQLNYVDLYLIHSPVGLHYLDDDTLSPMKGDTGKADLDLSTDLEGIWTSMELLVDSGLTKSIGLSNYSPEQIERIVKIARIPPANLQVEMNAYFQQKDLRQVCAKHGITVCGFGAMGSTGRKAVFEKAGQSFESLGLLEDPVVKEISEAHGKNPAQVLLKFLTQQNVVVIPKSVTAERIQNNIKLFDFELNPEEMAKLDQLDRGKAARTFLLTGMKGSQEHPEYPYKGELIS